MMTGGSKISAAAPTSHAITLEDLIEHFALIYGTDLVWDGLHRITMKIGNMAHAHGTDNVRMWKQSPGRRVVKQENIVFDPTESCDPDEFINLYNGLAVSPIPCGEHDVSVMLELLRHLCANSASPEVDADQVVRWVLCWLALPLQRPGAKLRTALVFHGPQGAGKNLFFDAIRSMYGPYGVMVGQTELEEKYNSWLSAKLLVLGNEVVTRQELYHNKNKLKWVITEDMIPIRGMHLDVRWERNHANVVFMSNEQQPLALEEGDRRYVVVYTPQPEAGTLYARAAAFLKAGGAAKFLHFLLNYDVGNFGEHTKPIMTAAKADLIEIGMRPSERFMMEWINHFLPLPMQVCSADQLYRAFRRWCELAGERFPPPRAQFTRAAVRWLEERCETDADGSISKPRLSCKVVQIKGIANLRKAVRCWIPRGKEPPAGVTEGDWALELLRAFNVALTRFCASQMEGHDAVPVRAGQPVAVEARQPRAHHLQPDRPHPPLVGPPGERGRKGTSANNQWTGGAIISGSTGPLSFAPAGVVDTFEVVVYNSNATAVLNLQIDDAVPAVGPATFTFINTSGFSKITVKAAAPGTHVLKLSSSIIGAGAIRSMTAYNSLVPAVDIITQSVRGASAATQALTNASWFNLEGLKYDAPDITTIKLGLLALSDDGWLIGANAAALAMLGIARGEVGASTVEGLLQLDVGTLLAWSRQHAGAPRPMRRHDGSVLWARVEMGRHAAAAQPGRSAPRIPLATPVDPLAALDTGDTAMLAAIGRARRVLDKPIALLLQGESGVGKEVFAQAMHASGMRRDRPFVAVNCAALPEALIEAELFGYRPGAFTGAGRDGAPGRIREAHGGTLFLDEIGNMPLALQARLLRVLQDRQVQPLGGGKPVAVDFRLVCATHRDLRGETGKGRFREDLYYRLNGLTLRLPPLRERQDQAQLTARMLGSFLPGRDLHIAPELALAMSLYHWPGNLRQLHNALQTACAMLDDGDAQIEWGHLPDDLAEDLRFATRPRRDVDEAADLRSRALHTIEQAIQSCAGNLSEAARRLGISRNTLYRKLRETGLR